LSLELVDFAVLEYWTLVVVRVQGKEERR